ncbi:hypothetical protein [Algoriphagus confluentis]|uniref:FUSC family protein n=1 Tax=Algoriphagus confluentis TaxID=1697556 RepID=A0ABQ6PR65_9BACT|nr:hypothetical protein Aconfl_23980 [Algoriphagus confluentis]
MTREELTTLSNEELLAEKKKLKNSKIFHATLIGFLIGILLFGFGAWILSPEKQAGFLIPMIFPIWFVYKMLKTPKKDSDLEEVLRERGLD